jgi:hypothetical protein
MMSVTTAQSEGPKEGRQQPKKQRQLNLSSFVNDNADPYDPRSRAAVAATRRQGDRHWEHWQHGRFDY